MLEPLQGVREQSRIKVQIELPEEAPHPLAGCIGILSDEDAAQMRRAVKEEFEEVNFDEWK